MRWGLGVASNVTVQHVVEVIRVLVSMARSVVVVVVAAAAGSRSLRLLQPPLATLRCHPHGWVWLGLPEVGLPELEKGSKAPHQATPTTTHVEWRHRMAIPDLHGGEDFSVKQPTNVQLCVQSRRRLAHELGCPEKRNCQ